MQSAYSLLRLWIMIAGLLAVAAVVAGFRLRPAAPSRPIILVAVLPALIMLGLFYSLAVHMHSSLGAWPSSIGERGFPSSLVTHAGIATGYFGLLLWVGIFAWPVAFLLCAFVRRWRSGLFYLGVYALSCLLCFGAMLLAPSKFLYWWWD